MPILRRSFIVTEYVLSANSTLTAEDDARCGAAIDAKGLFACQTD